MNDNILSMKNWEKIAQHLDNLLKQHESIFNILPTPICVSTDGQTISMANEAALRFLGLTEKTCIGQPLLNPQVLSNMNSLKRIKSPCGEITIIEQDEQYYYVEALPYGEQGKIQIIHNIADSYEITEIVDSLSLNIPGGIFKIILDDDLHILYANEIFYQMHGYTETEMKTELENKALNCVHPDDRASVKTLLAEAIQRNDATYTFHTRIVTRNGEIRWMFVNCYFIDLAEGKGMYGFIVDYTVQKQTEQNLKVSEERFRIALSMIESGFWDYDIQTKEIYQYGDFLKKYGIPDFILENIPESMVEQHIIHPESVADFYHMYERMNAGDKITSWTGKVRNESGEYTWTKITHHSIFDENGHPIRAIGIYEDIHEKKEMEINYQQEVLYREALTSDVIASYKVNLTKDELEDSKRNKLLLDELPNHCTHEDILLSGVHSIVHPEDKKKYYELFSPESIFRNFANGEFNVEMEYLRKMNTGDIIWVSTICNLMKEPTSGDLYVFTYTRNIDSRKKLELSLKKKAEHDSLTLLYNKATTEALITDYLNSRGYFNKQCALCMIDIDNFKLVNDNLGHAYGDKVLCDIAKILKKHAHSSDIVGRVGGDEFIIFFKNIVSEDWMHHKAKKICKALHISYRPDLHISGSMGIVLAKTNEAHFQWLYEKADLALYKTKHQGKNGYLFFHETIDDVSDLQNLG